MLRLALILPVLLHVCSKDETLSGYADPDAVYVLQELDGAPFTARAEIAFAAPGEATGVGPCNRFSARQAVPLPWFELTDFAATRRACAEMPAEAAYFDALAAMSLAEVSGPFLILSNDLGRQMVFRAAQD